MNARIHAPEKYFSDQALNKTGDRLSLLADATALDGLIFSDPYYLQALSDTLPDLAQRMEAIPSINTMISSAEQAFAILDMIASTRFKAPSKLVLDRCLNRDATRLEETVRRIRDAYPDIKLILIANEGCLYRCPYKPAHDAHVAMVNEGLCGERTFTMNHDFGCVRRLLTDPGAMLASPFIRPEDTRHFEGIVDGIKLCGRNKGTEFLIRAVTAYLSQSYEGNILDLMDAMGDLSHRIDIPNHRLPDIFSDHVTNCDKHCKQCGWCTDLAESILTRHLPELA